MIQMFLHFDRVVLLYINGLPHNLFSDSFFLFFSVAGYYGLIWFILAVLLFLLDGLDNRREVVALFSAVILEVLAVELFLKNIFMRVRPEVALPGELVKVMTASIGYSFPSGHATMAFAGAYILSQQRRNLAWFFYLLAILVAFSRVYLGKHYPSDVLIGALLGWIIGFFSYRIEGKIRIYKK